LPRPSPIASRVLMTAHPKPRRSRKKAATLSEGDHNAMVLFEKSESHMKLVLEAVQGCVRRTEFEEFKGQVNERFDRVDMRFEKIDQRFEKIDQRFEKIDQRFEQIDQRFEQMDRHFALVIGELRSLRKDVAGHAQASELRALDQRVTALERRS
jgi:archaellum component FlaC